MTAPTEAERLAAGLTEGLELVARAIAAQKRNCSTSHPDVDRVWTSYVGQARSAVAAFLSAQPALPDGVGQIVERLRAVESSGLPSMEKGATTSWYRNPDGPEAADTILALQAENTQVKDAWSHMHADNKIAWDKVHELQARVAALEEDKARLDFLDECNIRLNAKYGTSYGWKLILNHNVNRLMLGHMDVDLHDTEGSNAKLPSCRKAIDERMNEAHRARALLADDGVGGEG